MSREATSLVKEISAVAKSFQSIADLADVMNKVKRAKVVMLGEASHGTHEYYRWRHFLSQELVEKHGFNFIAVEGDWPPSQRVNRFINLEEDETGDRDHRGVNLKGPALRRRVREILRSFKRWPTWMWANLEVEQLVEWMRTWNSKLDQAEKRVGFYGLDVYSLFESIEEALTQLEQIDPKLAMKARLRYQCFDPYMDDEQEYARSLLYYPEGCREGVIKTLQELLQKRLDSIPPGKHGAFFDAVQNARIVKNAESYYRAMIQADDKSWNVRDKHMMETLNLLLEHYGPESKGILWAHNTHIGDYRATSMKSRGEVNIGGLAREQYGEENVGLVGFSTYEGTVIASHAWGGSTEVLVVPPARDGSWDAEMHDAAIKNETDKLALVFEQKHKRGPLAEMRHQRAIGVVYNPAYEKWGNYVPTSLSRRYDALLFLDFTRALDPLPVEPDEKEIPADFPFGY
jgi:erythromycin esterase-like protein